MPKQSQIDKAIAAFEAQKADIDRCILMLEAQRDPKPARTRKVPKVRQTAATNGE